MKVYRCRICGDAYLGTEKPSNCPYCGAHQQYLVEAKDWRDENDVPNMTEVSRKNLEKALDLEISNSRFYKCAADLADMIEYEGMFKGLAKVEREHAATIRKLLKTDEREGEERKAGVCKDSILDNLREACQREERASLFYSKSAEGATEPRVKEFFSSLVEIESDHLTLSDKAMEKF